MLRNRRRRFVRLVVVRGENAAAAAAAAAFGTTGERPRSVFADFGPTRIGRVNPPPPSLPRKYSRRRIRHSLGPSRVFHPTFLVYIAFNRGDVYRSRSRARFPGHVPRAVPRASLDRTRGGPFTFGPRPGDGRPTDHGPDR